MGAKYLAAMYVGVLVVGGFVGVGAGFVGVYVPRGDTVVDGDVLEACGTSRLGVAGAGGSVSDFEDVDSGVVDAGDISGSGVGTGNNGDGDAGAGDVVAANVDAGDGDVDAGDVGAGDVGVVSDGSGDVGTCGSGVDNGTGDVGDGDLGTGGIGAGDVGAGDGGAGNVLGVDVGTGDAGVSIGASDFDVGDVGTGDVVAGVVDVDADDEADDVDSGGLVMVESVSSGVGTGDVDANSGDDVFAGDDVGDVEVEKLVARLRTSESVVCLGGCAEVRTTLGCAELGDSVYVENDDGDGGTVANGNQGLGVIGTPVSVCVVSSVAIASASKDCTENANFVLKASADAVVDGVGSGGLVSAVRMRVRVVCRASGFDAYVGCASAAASKPTLGKAVNVVPIFIITAARS